MPAKKTTVDIDLAIQHRPLIRVGDYKNYDTKITWRCNTCTHEWDATPNNVISKNSGCPKCGQIKAGKSKSGGQLDRVLSTLLERNITLVSPYTRVKDHHDLKCNACAHEWSTTLNVLLNSKTIRRGCVQCSGLTRLTNEEIDRRLAGRIDGVVRVGNYINATTKIEWRCGRGHTWLATPDAVAKAGVGCSECSPPGFKIKQYFDKYPDMRTSPAHLYLVKVTHVDTGIEFLKVGITKNSIHKRYAGYSSYDLVTLHDANMTMEDAAAAERAVIRKWKALQFLPPWKFHGRRECFVYSQEIIDDFRATYCSG